MAPSKVVLLACGSFNPPTNMHLRMFELARDNLNRLGQYVVIGGIVSPVHEAYGKKELIPGTYRCEMLKLALKSSDWIQISDWECSQETWSRTRRVLQYHQNMLNSVLNDPRDSPNNNQINDVENGYDYTNWITNDIRNTSGPVQIKLLCGADLLESFATPGLWADEDIETIIGQHGIVVITRQGSDPRRFIYESDILTKYQHNIVIVTEWITNDVSSTKVRRALRRQESVKYLLEDSVIDFIKKHELYGTMKSDANLTFYCFMLATETVNKRSKYNTNLNETLIVPGATTYILTPSPSDVNMVSASSSDKDIFLNLKPIPAETFPLNSPSKSLKSPGDFKVSPTADKRKESKGYQYPGQAVPVVSSGSDDGHLAVDQQRKKVGFSEGETVDVANEDESNVEEEVLVKSQRKPSKKYSRLTDGDNVRKSESEENACANVEHKGNLLRRSKSDAVMSRKGQNGETVSVKIQFTKEGIKVISDKESIV
ncbi:hypothetical protein RUM43_012818 [Polyplax serrata]|uniref:Nicotinamide/nicotinic acid mononucleotide adenylyltransferase 3 n=1 Tax=Polyplax serrata TaxID=468196 RepID=A0AAN8RZD2_POLSC